ncbi:MAG: Ribonuclease P protein component 2 [Methanosaeta sp. PtaB.Bin039]|nr:MAG: Ribonuclease P protein component 2 [Methanosaeta sp. PtaB.Bin039]OPY44690.1 MAG: Ribonuclease P protein component 2 [Methanosaeta sp. PtaU1.Bin028]HOT06762.1 Rpp14/Pop5 family protein [Methanotrichaceae archaeon]HQF15959.1 Rpp14/Pop5 family protein [Methanotrichaceae archaeon]HQI90693.1 Rpp14/Pop5 family protein [Methanotrichaceae archaeon]
MRSRLPVLRERRRYLAFELESEGQADSRGIMQEVHLAYSSLFGDTGGARPRLISFDGQFGIIRFQNGYLEELRAAMATITSVCNERAAVRVRGVSGTIKAATEKYIPQRALILAGDRRRVELEGISGSVVRIRGCEIDISPEDRADGLDTRYLGLTCFDIEGGCNGADGPSNGI